MTAEKAVELAGKMKDMDVFEVAKMLLQIESEAFIAGLAKMVED